MSKSCHFIFQDKNEIYIFTINKPNIMKKKLSNNIFIALLFE